MFKFGNEKSAIEAISEAMKSGDEEQIKQAWEQFHNSIADQIRADFEEAKNTQDSEVLARRGYRQLTSRETQWYTKLAQALKSKNPTQTFAEILGSEEEEDLMPETIMEDVYKDLTEEYPILGMVNFQHVRYLTKWVLNDHTAQKAVWGEITDEITKEITSAFKVINVNQSKLSAYAAIERGMLDLGPTFLDGYIRAVLRDALSLGLEDGIVNGNGKDCPIGMTRDIHKGVSFNEMTGYPAKSEESVTEFNPLTYGTLLSKMAKAENGRMRRFDRVALAVNLVTYFTKIMPATKVQDASGKYVSYLDSIFPTEIVICNSVEDDKAVMFLPKEYYLLMGGPREGQLEISDEYKFLEDMRYFKIRQYGTGRAFDDTCCLVLDVSGLKPAAITVKTEAVENP